MRGWMRYFGPMRTLVSDQETSVMSVEAGSECQRLGIRRQPAGTTTGAQGKQHSTTGLVEKHIDLTKLTMLKLKAEAERWGIEIEKEELAAEAAMAQNLTISYGGYSPTTMVFGVLPRGYLDPEGEIYGDEGQLNPTESTFERSLRLRQIALQASQAAILESRIARANRSRPQRLAVEDIKPGTTKVEIFRDDGQGHGWRGPGTVLQLNEEAGTAIVEYQQRPYILPLRHVRPLRESFLLLYQDLETTSKAMTPSDKRQQMMDTTSRMKQVVEKVNPYRPYTFGEILHEKDDTYTWKKYPSEENEIAKRMLADAKEFLDYHYNKVTLHGVKFGKGMKAVAVPKYSKGILMLWPEGKTGFSLSEHNSDSHLNIKHIYNKDADETCHIYFYGYILYNTEDGQLPAKITRRSSQQDDRPDSSREEPMDVENVPEDLKRKDPDSRTVVLAPEKKKQRYDFEIHDMFFARTLWWMMQRQRTIRLAPHSSWYEHEVRWMRELTRRRTCSLKRSSTNIGVTLRQAIRQSSSSSSTRRSSAK